MTIKINISEDYIKELELLETNINIIQDIDEVTNLTNQTLKQIYKLLNNSDLRLVCRNILKNKYLESFSYEDLNSLHEVLESFYMNLDSMKKKIDIDMFFEKGSLINIKKLKIKFKALGRDKIYPNFNFKRLEELFRDPPKSLPAMDGSNPNLEMIYDPYIVRKYIYGIIQMVVNEMDLLVGFTGSEGMGKSCGCSQHINLVYYLLKELGLIEYEYNIKDIWFGSLNDFQQAEDKFFSEKFRILGLDEGNELNRQDWQDESVKTFFQRLRRERFNQRIKFICLPQLGELMTSIVLSRMNFIINVYSKDDIQTGTLDKGFCNFYIIPRNDKIYSPHQKREISKREILNILGVNLNDKKEYLKEIPPKLLIKKYRFNYIWGFDKKDYDKYIKESNKNFTVAKGARLTEYEAYCYFKTRPNLKNWNMDRKEDREMYATVSKLDRKICKMFEENPDKLLKYDTAMQNKLERRS